jgi:hypothetical protein
VIFSERIRMSHDDGQQPGPQSGVWVPPPQHFAPPPPPAPPAVVAPVSHREAGPGRLRAVLVGAAALGVLAAAGLAVTSGEEDRPGPTFVGLPPVPPVPMLPGGTPAEATPTRSAPPATTRVRGVEPAGPARTAGRTPAASAAPAVALPVVGKELGLEPVGEPGHRVRHRNFIARIDPVGPASPALDRADSRFTVRAGRAGAGCLSFESFNYPGYFLRARDAALRLERADGSRGYDADATFCAVPAAAGGFVLGSRSDPTRFVTEDDAVLSLNRVALEQAQSFVTRPAL